MTDVDDTIWDAITSDPNASAAFAAGQPSRRRRSWWLTFAAPLCVVVAVSAFLLQAGGNHAAYALTVQPDGTIDLTLSEVEGIEGANSELAHMGVSVRIARLSSDCTEVGEPDQSASSALLSIVEPAIASDGISWRIHPSAVPDGDTVLLEARTFNKTRTVAGFHAMLYRGSAPACLSSEEAQ